MRAPDILQAVCFRCGERNGEFVGAGGDRGLGAAQIRDEHGNREMRNCQCVRHHIGCVCKLRHPMRRDETAYFYFAQTARRERSDPRFLAASGMMVLMLCKPIARPNFADKDVVDSLLSLWRRARAACRARRCRECSSAPSSASDCSSWERRGRTDCAKRVHGAMPVQDQRRS